MIQRHHHRRMARSVAFTTVLLGLISLAIGGTSPSIGASTFASVIALALVFHLLLPGSDFFCVVFANSIGVYACLYVFLVSVNFTNAGAMPMEVGFLLPLVTFLGGVIYRRRDIGRLLSRTPGAAGGLHRLVLWVLPLVAICFASFVFPMAGMTGADEGEMLIIFMGLIAGVAFFASRDIAVFLLDTGILFEDFFANAARLAKPAFAFLTCYSLVIITFASIYTILDRYTGASNFVLSGTRRALSFADGLYLSVCTLSTVGYGDITAASGPARMLVAIETVSGILLLLFGVEALLVSGRRAPRAGSAQTTRAEDE